MPVGISDMRLYVPTALIELASIVAQRSTQAPELERRLRRAVDATGQIAIRFPAHWQDSVTLAAEAIAELLDETSAPRVRHLAVGTESSVDMSKPIAAYAHGVLQRAGVPLSRSLSTFQVQHACAGGTIALTSVAAMLSLAARNAESGVVVCSDVARYQTPSTAEITQGAGAVAMLVEPEARLLQLDLATIGYASTDVDDFSRPLASVTARVKGRYSVDCYNDALEAAFDDHAARRGVTVGEAIESSDLFVLHVPFYKMAVTALTRLVERKLGLHPAAAAAFLQERHFHAGIEATRHIGNIYSGSVYMSLMFALADAYRRLGRSVVGTAVTIASYGSGNTMTMLRGTVAPGAIAVLADWDLDAVVAGGQPAPFGDYERFVEPEVYALTSGRVVDPETVPPNRYFLREIREDGYRVYDHRGT